MQLRNHPFFVRSDVLRRSFPKGWIVSTLLMMGLLQGSAGYSQSSEPSKQQPHFHPDSTIQKKEPQATPSQGEVVKIQIISQPKLPFSLPAIPDPEAHEAEASGALGRQVALLNEVLKGLEELSDSIGDVEDLQVKRYFNRIVSHTKIFEQEMKEIHSLCHHNGTYICRDLQSPEYRQAAEHVATLKKYASDVLKQDLRIGYAYFHRHPDMREKYAAQLDTIKTEMASVYSIIMKIQGPLSFRNAQNELETKARENCQDAKSDCP